MDSLVHDWNDGMEEAIQAVRKQNEELKAKYDRKEISAEGVAKGLLEEPTKLKPPGLRWCRQFRDRFGWSLLTRSVEQASLPWDHPDMEWSRNQFQMMLASGVHPHLVLNFDQVWRSAFNWTGKMLWKPREKLGQVGKRMKSPQRLEKKLHSVRGFRKSLTASWPIRVNYIVMATNTLQKKTRKCFRNLCAGTHTLSGC